MTVALLTSTAWPDDTSGERTLDELRRRAEDARGSIDAALDIARRSPESVGLLTVENAGRYLASLGALAAGDVTVARVVEPHLDALGILSQAGIPAEPGTSWGVFAAEAPGTVLLATPTATGVTLDGRKPWCSLAGRLSHALLTAHLPLGGRGLFRVDLRGPGVTAGTEWAARGLPLVPSGPVDFESVPAEPVGEPGWYLSRPGFAWGGVAVAACWWGGAVALVDHLREAVRARQDSELALAALGAATIDLTTAEQAIADAARAISTGRADGRDGTVLAQRVRSTVRGRVEAIRGRVVSTLGPAPLVGDAAYLARVADLELYVQQDHGDRDLARLGRLLLERAA